jgi:lantibiotic transport system ATP-binding protein
LQIRELNFKREFRLEFKTNRRETINISRRFSDRPKSVQGWHLALNLACLFDIHKPIKNLPNEITVSPAETQPLQNRFSINYIFRHFRIIFSLMTNYCIETIDLTHKFANDEIALNRVNLQVIEGSIYGFLGPNGAGKTTTLKLILGLLIKQRGEITVFGKPFAENRVETLRRIGSMIESPSIYGHLTAVENLQILQKIYQCPKSRIAEVLELVGLTDTGSKKTSQFSLGMKQRLSIAIALLHSPSLLILDEPTNGLDPNGILEIRELLQNLNQKHNITILISSHLLSEIEKLVTHIGIIHKGNLLFQGTLNDLIAKQQQSTFITFETSDKERTFEIIKGQNSTARIESNAVLLPIIGKEKIAEINKTLVDNGIEVYQISTIKNDLEAIFFDVIGG